MKSQSIRPKPLWKAVRVMVIGVAATLAVAGCASATVVTSTGSFKPVKQVANSSLTVWVDSTRLPMVQAFEKSHPSVKIKTSTIDTSTLQTKISLDDKAGSGWPDVVFSGALTDVGWASTGKTPFAAPLNQGLIPQSKISKFAPTSLNPCTVGGTLYCLRNDIAQNVLWYNKTLLDQFGYSVPTTWQQYEALGAKVAKEHPGYVVGSIGDPNAPQLYFWGSSCPAATLNGTTFSSNLSSPNCTRMATMLDTMVANKSITTEGPFSTTYPADYGAKTLMLVGPSWYGQYLFNGPLKTPAGQIAAAAPLAWKGEKAVTGNVGGGVWYVSSHSKNLKGAAALVNWLTTSNANQSTAATYPAYAPAAAAWLKNPANTKYFATDVGATFTKAAGEVWPGWSGVSRADPTVSWGSYVLPQLASGKTITETLPSWQTQILNQATTVGYTVKK
jgi:ABC-type glycerol-3-phosphate transport system substrate-binding protein